MRQVMVRVPRGEGGGVLEAAGRYNAVNVSRWDAAGEDDRRYEMVLVHLANERVGPFADELEALPDVHLSLLDAGALALRPPTDEVAGQTRDVTPRSPFEVYLAGLQSIGSWKGFLGYAGIAGVVVWIGLVTDTAALMVGAMLIAPFASPAVNAALATARGDGRLLAHALARYGTALSFTIGVAALLTLIFRQTLPTDQMVRVANVSPAAFLLPLAAGAAGALTLCQSQRGSLVSGAGAGLLVAASLAPPAGVVGISAVLGRWDLAASAGFLLVLQLVGIDLAGAVVFRLFGVGPQGRRYPHGHAWAARIAGVVIGAAFAGLLALQFATPRPTLVRAGLEERARSAAVTALRQDPEVRVLDVWARFPRPDHAAHHPLLLRVAVERRDGAAAVQGVRERTAMRVADAVAARLPRVTPLVDVTVLERPSSQPR
ncbi:MAG: DUF389 domain-containing protein [Gemmatimonadetes bacterium]|nr:DUF389 domain-containing protein [Gemmatimonadota bacterium]